MILGEVGAKIKNVAELLRKARQLEQLNAELARQISDRTAELERSTRRLQQSEDRRNLALLAGKMGSWDWDLIQGDCVWDEGQRQIFGVDAAAFEVTLPNFRRLVHDDDWKILRPLIRQGRSAAGSYQVEFRIRRPDGEVRWCLVTAVASKDACNRISHISGVTIDITDRKETEERQRLLAREIDHRAKNALAVVQAIVSLTRSDKIESYVSAVEGRIQALARAHSLLSESRWGGVNIAQLLNEELAPFASPSSERVVVTGTNLSLDSSTAQVLALALHELATNAASYGALSVPAGAIDVAWNLKGAKIELRWVESGGPPVQPVASVGFGLRVIKASIESQLGGTVEFDWAEDGLRCTIVIPHQDSRERAQKAEISERLSGTSRTEASRISGRS